MGDGLNMTWGCKAMELGLQMVGTKASMGYEQVALVLRTFECRDLRLRVPFSQEISIQIAFPSKEHPRLTLSGDTFRRLSNAHRSTSTFRSAGAVFVYQPGMVSRVSCCMIALSEKRCGYIPALEGETAYIYCGDSPEPSPQGSLMDTALYVLPPGRHNDRVAHIQVGQGVDS